MKTTTYRELSQTSEGRKQAHELMISDVKTRIENLINSAPESNRQKVQGMMNVAFEKISNLDNGKLFNFFADDEISDNNFVLYIVDVINNKI